MSDTARGWLIVVIGIVLVAVVSVGGWFLYWGVTQANQNQQYQVNTHSQQYQQSLVEQERSAAQGYQTATNDAQKQQISSRFCAVYTELTHPEQYPDLVQDQATMCH